LAEQKAMEYALNFRSFSMALHFLHAWPEPRQAARLVLARQAEIDGNLYSLLDPAARWLESTSPLAATLLRRAMIADTLDGAKSKRYRHAVGSDHGGEQQPLEARSFRRCLDDAFRWHSDSFFWTDNEGRTTNDAVLRQTQVEYAICCIIRVWRTARV